MKISKTKINIQRFGDVRGYILLWLISCIAICILGAFEIMMKKEIGQVCMKDYIISVGYKVVSWSVFPTYLLAIIRIVAYMSQDNKVIRYESIRRFRLCLMTTITKFTIIEILLFMISIILSGWLICNGIIDNWSEKGSYAIRTYDTSLTSTNLIGLAVWLGISLLLICEILAMLIIIIHRITGTLIIGYILCIAITFAELSMGYSRLLVGMLRMTDAIYVKGLSDVSMFVRPIVLVILELLVMLFMRRGDYVGKEKI